MKNRLFMVPAITCSLVLLCARTNPGSRLPKHAPTLRTEEASPTAVKVDPDASNLVLNPGFEEPTQVPAPPEWTAVAWQGGATFALDGSQAHSGRFSARIAASVANDARWIQTIPVTPDTRYVLSGWIKTRKIQVVDGPTRVGANLCLHDTWDHTTGVLGTTDWTYQEMYFDSGDRTEVTISCRLGYWAGIVTGTMWCDDIVVRPKKMAGAGPQ